jgi:protein-S-isoprenylcysteine O-methyltransferase Ste14
MTLPLNFFQIPPTSADAATIAFAVALLIADYLTYLCWTPPNPNSLERNAALPKDDVGINPRAIQARRFITLSLWILHGLLTPFYPSPPAVLCLNLDNLSSSPFTWSPYTTVVLVFIAIAAPIRLLTFGQLGKNSTLRLVKTCQYAYIQHPSYPTKLAHSCIQCCVASQSNEIMGCILPGPVVRWGMWSGGFRVWPSLLVVLRLLGLYGISVRVKDKEAMLKREFGKEWEEYHRRTKRFIPGVF